jgi:hypothetical protein
MRRILLSGAVISLTAGIHVEAEFVGKKFFGCSPKPWGISLGSPEPDYCILIKVLSESEMKLQVYARSLKKDLAMNVLKTVAETMSVFPKVSFTLIDDNVGVGIGRISEGVEKSLRVNNEAKVDGMEYDLWTGKESRVENMSLLKSLWGKIAPNHDVLMPKQIEFLSAGDGTLWFRESTQLKRIVKQPDWNVEMARETKRRNPRLFFTPNTVLEKKFSPRCGAKSVKPGHYYGEMTSVRVEMQVFRSSAMRLSVSRGKVKYFFHLVKFVFNESNR